MNISAADKKPGKGSPKARALAARMAAVQAVYQMMSSGQSPGTIIEEYVLYRLGKPMDGHAMVMPDGNLFEVLVKGVADRRADLLQMIGGALRKSSGGDAETGPDTAKTEPRIDALLQAILLCGTYEILASSDVDSPIIISDYLNVTHGFYDQGESRLVNAVLDALNKSIRGSDGADGTT